RPLAYGADRYPLPKAPLDELRKHSEPLIALWADYAAAVSLKSAQAIESLRAAAARHEEAPEVTAAKTTPEADAHETTRALVARALLHAYGAPIGSSSRREDLDSATRLLCDAHPEIDRIMMGQASMEGQLPK